jgi:hypothetical protein
MNLYEACINLGIWHIAKARAEIWSLSETRGSSASLDDLKGQIKTQCKKLAMVFHPDVGGNHGDMAKIQESHNLVKKATTHDFINALDIAKEVEIVLYEPGSLNCKQCRKWSDMLNICSTENCTGFNQLRRLPGKKIWSRNIQNSSFFSKGSRT